MVEITGTIKQPSGPRNPKGFDYRSYLKRRGIYSTVSINERNAVLINKANFLSLDRVLALLRNRSSTILEQAVGGREDNFLKAVLLGERWLVEPEVEEAFTRTGLAHILAISGLHIGYLVLLLNFILFSNFAKEQPFYFKVLFLFFTA